MRPWEFAECTPGEIEAMVAAFNANADAEMGRYAWQTALIGPMVWSQKAYQPNDLLGWEEDAPDDGKADALKLKTFMWSLKDQVDREKSH